MRSETALTSYRIGTCLVAVRQSLISCCIGPPRFVSRSFAWPKPSRSDDPVFLGAKCASVPARLVVAVHALSCDASSRAKPITVEPDAHSRSGLTDERFRASASSGCGERPSKRRTVVPVLDAGEIAMAAQQPQQRPRRMRPGRTGKPTRNQPRWRTCGALSGACVRYGVERCQPMRGQPVARIPVHQHRVLRATRWRSKNINASKGSKATAR